MANPTTANRFSIYNVDPDSTGDRPEQALVLENGNLLLIAGELPYTGADIFLRQFNVDGSATTPLATANTTTFGDQVTGCAAEKWQHHHRLDGRKRNRAGL